MGMYTELIFGARVDKNKLSEIDLESIRYIFGYKEFQPAVLPNHPFFSCSRWKSITRCSSYYFGVLNIHRNYFEELNLPKGEGEISLSSRANLKNYDKEIEKFLDWIKPFIIQGSGNKEFYAIVTYEDNDEPTIYYLK